MKSSSLLLSDSAEFNPLCVSSPVPVSPHEPSRLLIPPGIKNDLSSNSVEGQSVNDFSNVDIKFLEDFFSFSQEFRRETANFSQHQFSGLGRRLSYSASQDLINDLLKLSNWSLPPTVLEAYKSIGIECMFRWQVECLMKQDILVGRNLVYSAPTSSGKTLVAEMLILKRIRETKKKALYVLPYVSIVSEKVQQLRILLKECGLSVGGFMGGSAPRGGFSNVDIAVCTIEKANSLVNRLIEEKSLDEEVCILVVDEIHMISDPHRGYLLELLLTKVKYLTSCEDASLPNNSLQIVGLSATLPNLDTLSKWLAAEFYTADFRPVELNEMILCENMLYDSKLSSVRTLSASSEPMENIKFLCRETVRAGHSLLIFCPTKRWCESICKNIQKFIKHNPSSFNIDILDKTRYDSTCQMLVESCKEPDPLLIQSLPFQVGFHHAGLTIQEREIVEGAFSSGVLRILAATSTLSSGVNLPARRVIIRSLTQVHNKVIEPVSYRQMCGRAGRTGLDDYGESILVCNPSQMEKARALLNATLKPIYSCLNTDNTEVFQHYGIKRALLEVITCGIVRNRSEAQAYIHHTLLATHSQESTIQLIVETCFRFLLDSEFIEYKNKEQKLFTSGLEGVAPTQLGSATLSSSLSPDEALFVIDEINRARQSFVLENDLHMVYLVTPICLQDLWSDGEPKWKEYMDMIGKLNADMKRVADRVGVSEGYITSCINGSCKTYSEGDRKLLAIHKRFRAALALNELVREVPLHKVARKFDLPKGQLQSLQIAAGTFAGMVTVFCKKLGFRNIELLISQFQTRLEFGIEHELTELVKISLLNGYRARAIYSAGFHSLVLIADAGIEIIAKTLRDAHPFHQQDRPGTDHKNWISSLRKGLTVREVAAEVIAEAKQLMTEDSALPPLPQSPSAPSQPLSSVITPINERLRSSQSNKPHIKRGITGDSLCRSLFFSPVETSPPKRIKQDTQASLEIQTQTTKALIPEMNILQVFIEKENEFSASIKTDLGSHSTGLVAPCSLQDTNEFLTRFDSSQESDIVLDVTEPNFPVIKTDLVETVSPAVSQSLHMNNTSVTDIALSPNHTPEDEFVLFYSPTQTPIVSPPPEYVNSPEKPVNSTNFSIELFHQSILDNSTLSFERNLTQGLSILDSTVPPSAEEWNADRMQESAKTTFIQVRMPKNLSVSSIIVTHVLPNSDTFHKLEVKCSTSPFFSFALSIKPSNLFSTKIESSPVPPDWLHGIALFFGEGQVYYIEQSPPIPFIESKSLDTFVSVLSLCEPPCCLVAWDIKSKLVSLLKCNVRIRALLADPQVAIWLHNPEGDPLPLSQQVAKVCCFPHVPGSWLDKLEQGNQSHRACAQAICSLLLMREMEGRLRRDRVFQVFLFNEMPVISNFAVLEVNGMALDSDILDRNSRLIELEMKDISHKAHILVQDNFDLSRESEVARVIFSHLKLPIPPAQRRDYKSSPRKNKHPSTSREVLLDLREKHPVVDLIIAHRREEYALHRCLYPLKKAIVQRTGRVYPKSNFHTVTGRVVLENPDLQHTPKDFDLPDYVSSYNATLSMRSTFKAIPGNVLISADYSQLELRILTHLCRDPTLMEIFSSPGDIFKLIASSFYKVSASDVTHTQRYNAKQICYGILYGMGCESLAKKMGISLVEATQLISSFKERFKEIDVFMDGLVSSCKEVCYVRSLLGRRRYVKNINSRYSCESGEAKRKAINTTIQSSASDLVKLGLNRIFRELHLQNIRVTPSPVGAREREVLFCNFLHDELIFEVPEHFKHKAGSLVKQALENAVKLRLPLPVVVKSGTSWGQLVPLDV